MNQELESDNIIYIIMKFAILHNDYFFFLYCKYTLKLILLSFYTKFIFKLSRTCRSSPRYK